MYSIYIILYIFDFLILICKIFYTHNNQTLIFSYRLVGYKNYTLVGNLFIFFIVYVAIFYVYYTNFTSVWCTFLDCMSSLNHESLC